MTKQEFEKIAKRTVTDEQYRAIETLYMSSNLDKYEFTKSIKEMLKGIPEENTLRKVVIGCKEMPNGTWMTYGAEVVDVNIKTGKIEVRRLTPNRFWSEISFDYHCARVEEVK